MLSLYFGLPMRRTRQVRGEGDDKHKLE